MLKMIFKSTMNYKKINLKSADFKWKITIFYNFRFIF